MNKLFYGDNLDVLRRKIASESVEHCVTKRAKQEEDCAVEHGKLI